MSGESTTLPAATSGGSDDGREPGADAGPPPATVTGREPGADAGSPPPTAAEVCGTPVRATASHDTLASAGDLLRALAAPVRIAIVLELRASPRCVHELVDALGVTQPLISQHLRVLKGAGVVRGDRRGREVVYRLVDDHLAHIVVDAVAHVEEEP